MYCPSVLSPLSLDNQIYFLAASKAENIVHYLCISFGLWDVKLWDCWDGWVTLCFPFVCSSRRGSRSSSGAWRPLFGIRGANAGMTPGWGAWSRGLGRQQQLLRRANWPSLWGLWSKDLPLLLPLLLLPFGMSFLCQGSGINPELFPCRWPEAFSCYIREMWLLIHFFPRSIKGVTKRVKRVMELLRLRKNYTGVFVKLNPLSLKMLRVVEPYVAWGYVPLPWPGGHCILQLLSQIHYFSSNGQNLINFLSKTWCCPISHCSRHNLVTFPPPHKEVGWGFPLHRVSLLQNLIFVSAQAA